MATEVEIGHNVDVGNSRQDMEPEDLEELPELDGVGICSLSRPSPPPEEPEIVTEVEIPVLKPSAEFSPVKNNENVASTSVDVPTSPTTSVDVPKSSSTSVDVPTSAFVQEEAALNAFLEESKPKPRKLTIKERLANLPGFDKISQMRPTLGGVCGTRINGKTIIDLTNDKDKKPSKLDKAMDQLLERFAKHAAAGVNNEEFDSKPHHVKIHVNKMEKDSQGELHAVVDEIDYISSPPDGEGVDIIAQVNRGSGSSPREQVPGEKMFRLKKALWTSIRARKAKEYEEKMKLHAMYNEEKELEDKDECEDEDELPEDEIIEEDEDEVEKDDTDSEVDDNDATDSEEEEELEEEYDGGVTKEKKKRRRLIYVEDEAEDEDEDRMSSSDDEGGTQDLDYVNNEDEEDLGREGVEAEKEEIENDTISQSQGSKILVEEDKMEDDNENSVEEVSRPLKQQMSDCDGSQSQPFVVPGSRAPFAELVAKTGQEIATKELDLSYLCSGIFPSQPPCTPKENSQYCFGFDEEDEDEEKEELQDIDENNATSESKVEEPLDLDENNESSESKFEESTNIDQNNATSDSKVEEFPPIKEVENIKTSEIKAKKAKTTITPSHRNKIDSDNEEDEEKGVVHSAKKIKPKRLHYSDDEEEDDVTVDEATATGEISEPEHEDDEIVEEEDEFINDEEEDEFINDEDEFIDDDDEEAAYERELVLQNTPKPSKGLFGKDGLLKKKFFETEAELSGSEEGSEDEDETGTNYYEQEDGDDEEMDHASIRKQLERAHLKHLLDKDDEEIRTLQNVYLERGDLEDGSKARERKFKWSDIDGGWADDKAMMGDEEGEEEETAEEIKRKIDEIERRKWMLENSEVLEASEEESQKLLFENSRFLKLGKSTRRKIDTFIESSSSSSFNVINQSSNGSGIQDFSIAALVKSKFKNTPKNILAFNAKNTAPEGTDKDKDEEDTIKLSRTSSSQLMFASPDEPASKFKRGSFLSRGSPSLSHLAEITKVNDGPNTNVKNNSRHFVFSTITPPEPASKQNKATKRPANSQGAIKPTKFVKIDRSFSNLDDSSKDASVFKWF